MVGPPSDYNTQVAVFFLLWIFYTERTIRMNKSLFSQCLSEIHFISHQFQQP